MSPLSPIEPASVGLTQPTNTVLRSARFQRDYLWDVLLPDIGMATGGLIGFGLGQLVQSVSFSDYDIESEGTRFGPQEAFYAGKLKVGNISMTFLKTMPDVVSSYFNSWKNLIITQDGLYNVKSKYQKNIYIRFVDQSGLSMGQYKMIGCFPIKFPSYNLSYDSDSVTKVTVEFKVDKIEYKLF